MARETRPSRNVFRRSLLLGTLVVVGVGGLALEHTATGATTGTPSHPKTSVESEYPQTYGKHGHGHDHPPRHCHDGHGKDEYKNKHCRPPSGG
jgi:hypothetical protein